MSGVRTKPYKQHLLERIRTPEEASGYLAACLEDGDKETIARCLLNIAEAWGVNLAAAMIVKGHEQRHD